jgi:uncharacterized membrane protein
MQVQHEWIAVSWAIELPFMALVAWKLDLAWLRRGIWAGAALIVAAVLLSGFPAGEWLIFNRLLYGIGSPCVGMIVTAQILKRMTDDREGRLLVLALELTGAGLLALLVGLEIDHFIGRVAPDSGRNLVRAGSMAIAWAAIALGLYRLYYRTESRDRAVIYAARAFTVIAVMALIFGCFMLYNPLFGDIDVGRTWFFNRLLVGYVFPGILMLLLAEQRRREPPPEGPVAAEALTLLAFATAFLWIALTVRQIVWGSVISFGAVDVVRTATQIVATYLGATGQELYGYAGSWAFLLPLMAFVAAKRGYRLLRHAIWVGVLLILGAIGASGLTTGEWLIFNPPLYGVGVPMISLLGTALYVERTTDEKEGRALVTVLPLIATALFALLVWLEVTQVVERITGDGDTGSSFLRNGLASIAWAAVALGFFRFERRKARKDRALLFAAYGFAVLTAAAIVIGGFLYANPLFLPIDVGSIPVFNRLLLVYGIPAALLLLLADRLRQQPLGLGPVPAQAAGLLALVTGFFWVTLTIRQLAHGAILDGGGITFGEQLGFSAAWTLYGFLLLGLGTWKRSQVLRYASAVVVLITVSKVFLIDASDLTGLYRVASFLGLGLSLIGIGYLYQRLLFRRTE